MNIITFLSDFGLNDGYVGSVAGRMLNINPNATIIDISHHIAPFQIEQSAYAVIGYYKYYPKDTVHLAVVDPGVGGERSPLMVKTTNYYFVGPDNGLFSYIFQNEAYSAYKIDITRLQSLKIVGKNISSTFHARDIFGPAAALLSKGIIPEKIGQIYQGKPVTFKRKIDMKNHVIKAKIICIDHFGNIITNVTKNELEQSGIKPIEKVVVQGKNLGLLKSTYSDVPKNGLLALWGSEGFLEISVNQGNAAKQLKCNIGQEDIKIYLKNH